MENLKYSKEDQTLEAHHVSGYIFMYLDDKPVEKFSFSQKLHIKFVFLRSPLHQNNVGEKYVNSKNEPSSHLIIWSPVCDLNDLKVDDNNEHNDLQVDDNKEHNDLLKENKILLSESLREVSSGSNYELLSPSLMGEVETLKIGEDDSSKKLVSFSDKTVNTKDLLAGLHCKVCQIWFPSFRKEKEHTRSPSCQTNCIQCGVIFPSKGDLFRHQYEAYSLSFLQSQFPEFNINTEIQRPNDKRKVVCPICSIVISFNQFKYRHIYSHFHELSYKCCHCGDEMKTSEQLATHCKNHTAKLPSTAQNKEVLEQPNNTGKICSSGKASINKKTQLKRIQSKTLQNMATKIKQKTVSSNNQELISSTGLNEQNLTIAEDIRLAANEEITDRDLERKQSYQCPYCKRSFSSRALFHSHKEMPSLNLKCHSCDAILPSQAWMIIHEFDVHKKLNTLTEKEIVSVQEVEEKDSGSDSKLYCNIHRPKFKQFVSCPVCTVSVTREVLPEHIMRRHTKEKPYKCCICGFPCYDSNKYREHCDEHIGKSKKGLFRCSSCPEIYTSKSDFRKHVWVHKYVCHFCNIDFQLLNLLDAHYNTEHHDQLIKCKQCDKRLPSEQKLRQHERHHRFNFRRPCPKCGAMVIGIKKHMESSHAEPGSELQCSICPKKFKQQRYLKAHLSLHAANNGGKKFACPKCPKSFNSRQYLTDHVRVHLNCKMHICPICGKQCREKFNLKIHMRIHSYQKLFHCDICNRGFNYKVSLINHQKSKHK